MSRNILRPRRINAIQMLSIMKIDHRAYQPLHCRSYYSLLSGAASPEEICRRAAAQGARLVGLTDINGLYGLPAFVAAAREAGLKPVYGVEIHWRERFLLTAYPLNPAGAARLNRLLSALYRGEAAERGSPAASDAAPFDPLQDLMQEGWEGLLLVSPSPAVLTQLSRRERRGLWGALYRGLPFRQLYRTCRRLGLPAAAFNRAVFHHEEHRRRYRLLRSVKACRPLAGLEESFPGPECLWASPEEMAAAFSALPEALEQTVRLGEMIEPGLFGGRTLFPRFRGLSDGEAFRLLRRYALRGVRERYGPLTLPVRRRLAYELRLIRRKGFSSYFLTVHDIVSRFPRTCGRGSSASSIVSYLLKITHVEPLGANLFFERFLNEERRDPPDIDLDFPWDEREKALTYVFKTYPGASAMVADHVTFRGASALREAARALGLGEEETRRITREARCGSPELPPGLRRAASLLEGVPRHLGTHPGGVVITPGPLTELTTVETAACGVPLIPWEKEGAEAAGLVKIDLLGNRSLSVLRDTMEAVSEREALDWGSFSPLDDPAAADLIRRGDTLGLFYCESPATRQLLKKMGRGDYAGLVAATSIIRPAANRLIGTYLRRMKGEESWATDPELDRVLAETFGIMVYQEDVSRVALTVAGFSPGEADALRKLLSRKERQKRLPAWKKRFLQGGLRAGRDPQLLDRLWEQVLSFAGYSFCKSHSASYALVSYRLAYLKARYPLEFFTAVINNGGGYYARQIYLDEIRRRGFPVLGPDINASRLDYRAEAPAGPAASGREGFPALRVGLAQISEISRSFLEKAVAHRSTQGAFSGYRDFFQRLKPGYREARALIRSGALDSLDPGLNRPQLFWAWYRREEPGELFPQAPPPLPGYSSAMKLKDEVLFCSLFLSRFPAALFRSRGARLCRRYGGELIDSRGIPGNRGKSIFIIGSLAAQKEVRTSQGGMMSFVSWEDEYGLFETVLFPSAYREASRALRRGYVFLLEGIPEEEEGVFQIRALRLIPLQRDWEGLFTQRPFLPKLIVPQKVKKTDDETGSSIRSRRRVSG